MVAQVIGSFLAVPVTMLANVGDAKGMEATYPNIGVDFDNYWWKAFLLEFFATFFLVFVVFSTAVDKRASPSVFG